MQETVIETTKVILVGRHASDLPENIEVVSQENILWATTLTECKKQWSALINKAHETDAAIVLQNVPGVLAAAMWHYALGGYGTGAPVGIGIVISVPGERLAGVTKTYIANSSNHVGEASMLQDAVAFVNARAKVEVEYEQFESTILITVDPVPQFKFSHIEWL